MGENIINLTEEQRKKCLLDIDNSELQIRKLNQQRELFESDIKDEIPMKQIRLAVRSTNLQIASLQQNIGVWKKRIREKKEVVETVTAEDLEKFAKAKQEEK